MPHLNTTVELNAQGQALCRSLAKKRYASNHSAGVSDATRGGQSDAHTDLEGVAAEKCFFKLLNLYPDLSIAPRSDDDGDCKLKDGRDVDVKSTRYKSGRLICVPWKKGNAPLFALTVGTFPRNTFKGFMPADDPLRAERLGSLGHAPTYIADQAEPVPFVLQVLEE
jgi:hypothetical protein